MKTKFRTLTYFTPPEILTDTFTLILPHLTWGYLFCLITNLLLYHYSNWSIGGGLFHFHMNSYLIVFYESIFWGTYSFLAYEYFVRGRSYSFLRAGITSIVPIVFLSTSWSKIRLVRLPLIYPDVFGVFQNISLFSRYYISAGSWKWILGSILFLLLWYSMFFFLKRTKQRLRSSRILSTAVLLIGTAAYVFVFAQGSTARTCDIKMEAYERGVMGIFLSTIWEKRLSRPDNYSLSDSTREVAARGNSNQLVPPPVIDVNNVILIEFESFIDPLEIAVDLNQDPIPNIRKFFSGGKNSRVLSPNLFAYTANTEFEVLTGIPVHFFGIGQIPYQSEINQAVPGLPAEFAANGFQTIALHNYKSHFYSRNRVFPLLGFQHSFFINDLKEKPLGLFYHDSSLYEKLLTELTANDKKKFILAITVSTHGPFAEVEEIEQKIKVLHPEKYNVTPSQFRRYQSYLNRLHIADKDFSILANAIEKMPRTAIVLYGDHWPRAAETLEAYLKLPSDTTSEILNAKQSHAYLTPVLVWLSKDLPQSKTSMFPAQGAYCLKSSIENLFLPEKSLVAKTLNDFCKAHPFIHPELQKDLTLKDAMKFRNLAYDMLHSNLPSY